MLCNYFSFDISFTISIIDEKFRGEFITMHWNDWSISFFLEENNEEVEENNYILIKIIIY
jgi:hypothetical protein